MRDVSPDLPIEEASGTLSARDAPLRLSVVVPFKDEEANLARYPSELFPELDALGVRWELVLVDDGSVDASRAVAERLTAGRRSAEQGQVKLVVHDVNRGLGAAIRSGIGAARGELLLTLDADLTFHPRDARRLYARFAVGDVDVVLGSPDEAGYVGVPWRRVLVSRIANLLYVMALGRRLTGITPIFRLYRTDLVQALELESEGFQINAEILAKLVFRGARTAAVPAELTTRLHGVSKLDTRAEVANHLRLLGRIVAWRFGR